MAQGIFIAKSINAIDGGVTGTDERRRSRPLHVLTAHDVEKLKLFYLGLDFDGRRGRFAAGVSDPSIIRHCQTLDWHRSLILGRARGYFLDAVLEIHPLRQSWGVAEIALTCPLLCKTTEIFSQLLQLAALLAGQKGCHAFLIARESCCRDTFALLTSMGKLRTDADHLVFDLGDYTLASGRSDRGPLPCANHKYPGARGEFNRANLHPLPGEPSTNIACEGQIPN